MGILRTNTLSGIGTDGPVFDGVTRLDTFGYVVPPVGVTSDRTLAGVTTAQGSIRFNTDSQKLEFFAQDQWFEMVIDTPALGTGADTGAGARGVFGGGESPSIVDTIDYINIASTGNAADFGNLSQSRRNLAGAADKSRGLFQGGYTPSNVNTVDFVTIASTGNATNFGDLTESRSRTGGCNNSTRGISAGGNPNTDTIDYCTIQSEGNYVDFGNLTVSRYGTAGMSSPTRGVFCGGESPVSGIAGVNTMDFITIATLGDAQDFGDMTITRREPIASSNAVRGVFGTGYTSPSSPYSASKSLDYVQIASGGNGTNFGDATFNRAEAYASFGNPVRGIISGGFSPGLNGGIDMFEYATEGNAVDFGDLSEARAAAAGFSNANGGL
jgi:hypothetical protein